MSAPTDPAPRPVPRLDLVGLVVADMPRTLAFYRRLGLQVPAAADGEDHVEVVLAGGLRLAFDVEDVVRSFDPGWRAPTGGHRVALAVDCGEPRAVDELWRELLAAGVHGHLPPWDAVWGQRYAVVHDPDGVPVDLFAALSPAAGG
ncbi:glyoxalase [Kineococcus sp. T13]|uniref:VOC family protein n=1 Tax=Kineococcus vitellinus TaxID=2696565 RepID=UPI001411DE76|nr:VOC family protein [Kineococcus vitellinus]NAZ75777.1 glyoxalase [Kineococcus vitellinus]